MSIDVLLIVASVIGTIAFSVSGALIAIENKLDLFGVLILGCVTACGGGMLRDVMLQKDVVLFEEPWYCALSLGTGLVVFLFLYVLKDLQWENSKIYKTFFNITDSIGLGAFVVVGANVCIHSGITAMFPIIFYSVLTAVGGGLIRDIMVKKIPVIFRKHIYAVAAIIGALYFYLIDYFNCPYEVSATTTVLIVVVIRYLAFHFEWSLPKVSLKEN